ncbi:MAG: nucleoid-structuring protein H-NS [Bryobacteraceae bacterium]|nr:MAG: nucleoid-structuring protein H-NS [Bryobacteraceae bacterium]
MEMNTIIAGLSDEVKALAGKFEAEVSGLREMKSQFTEIREIVDNLYSRKQAAAANVTLKSFLAGNADVQGLIAKGSGRAVFSLDESLVRKALTTAEVGKRTDHIGAYPAGTTAGRLRAAMTTIPAEGGAVQFARISTPQAAARAEGTATSSEDPSTALVTLPLQAISVMVAVSRQALEDVPALEAAITGVVSDSLENEIEAQVIAGNGTGANLTGFGSVVPAYTAPANEAKLDSIAKAAGLVSGALPEFVALNPADLWAIRTQKDSNGLYVFGAPTYPAETLFGLQVIPAPSMPAGKFLVGSLSPVAAALRQKPGVVVEISTEHADFFSKGLAAVRGEVRMALCIFRPAAFRYGTFAA